METYEFKRLAPRVMENHSVAIPEHTGPACGYLLGFLTPAPFPGFGARVDSVYPGHLTRVDIEAMSPEEYANYEESEHEWFAARYED